MLKYFKTNSDYELTVLKYSIPVAANFSAIFLVVITAATGCPLPIGLPTVTISGITPNEEIMCYI